VPAHGRRHFYGDIDEPVVQRTDLDREIIIRSAPEPCHALYHAVIQYK